MNEIPVCNDGDSPKYIGGYMIPAGETKMIPAHVLAKRQLETHIETVADPFALLLDANVETVSNGLPALSDDDLNVVEIMEASGLKRKGVAQAIDRERLRRADFAIKKTETQSLLATADVAQLNQQKMIVSEHVGLVNLIDNRLAELADESTAN